MTLNAVDLPWQDTNIACRVCGLEACEDHDDASGQVATSTRLHTASSARSIVTLTTATPLRFRPAAEIMLEPPPVAIIEGVAFAGCVTVMVAESATGKTFVLLGQASAVGANNPWHGRAVVGGSVAYLTFEGDALGLRLEALQRAGYSVENIYLERFTAPLSPRLGRDGEEAPSVGELAAAASLETLAATLHGLGLPPIRLVIIDTARASMTGTEDGSDNVAAYIRAGRRLLTVAPDAALEIAHHAGWQDGQQPGRKRERGSSTWRGNVDATLYLEAGEYDRDNGDAPLTLTALKVRDGEPPPPLHLIRRRVDLGRLDQHGKPVTSCVIATDQRTTEDRLALAKTATQSEQRVLDLRTLRAIAEHPDAVTGLEKLRVLVGAGKPAVNESVSRLARARWVSLPERQRQPYTLTDAGRAALSGGCHE